MAEQNLNNGTVSVGGSSETLSSNQRVNTDSAENKSTPITTTYGSSTTSTPTAPTISPIATIDNRDDRSMDTNNSLPGTGTTNNIFYVPPSTDVVKSNTNIVKAASTLSSVVSTNNEVVQTPINSEGIVNKQGTYVFESMAGSNTTILIEFPNYSKDEGSMYILMRSLVSVSVSVARAKIPITLLGNATVDGFALGTKTVAGTIIKALTYDDEFSKAIEIYTQKSLKDNNKTLTDLGSKSAIEYSNSKYKITQKQFDSIMRDDLVPFNIHTYSYSEYTTVNKKFLMNSIYGCTIINEGQTLSIENLITETTLTYVAKYAKIGVDASVELPSFANRNSINSGTSLLRRNKT